MIRQQRYIQQHENARLQFQALLYTWVLLLETQQTGITFKLVGRGISMELSDSFLDAAERFDDVFVARCIAHAEAFGRTESSTTDSGHMAYFKPWGSLTSKPGTSLANFTMRFLRRSKACRISSTHS